MVCIDCENGALFCFQTRVWYRNYSAHSQYSLSFKHATKNCVHTGVWAELLMDVLKLKSFPRQQGSDYKNEIERWLTYLGDM